MATHGSYLLIKYDSFIHCSWVGLIDAVVTMKTCNMMWHEKMRVYSLKSLFTLLRNQNLGLRISWNSTYYWLVKQQFVLNSE